MSEQIQKTFFTAAEMSKILTISKHALQNRASKAEKGSVWAQCDYGVWHIAQLEILTAVRANAIDLEVANTQWQLTKMRMRNNLQPSSSTAKKQRKNI